MGSIQQRGRNGYRLRVYAGLDPATRKRRYVERTVQGSRREAKAALLELEAQVRLAPNDAVGPRRDAGRAEQHTVEELWSTYSERVLFSPGHRMSEETRGEYERNWRLHLAPLVGHRLVEQLTVDDVEQLHARLLATPAHRRGGGSTLSVATVQKCHKLLSAMLTAAVRWEWIDAPHVAVRCGGLRQPTVRTVRAPTAAEVRLLLTAAAERSPAEGAFFRLAAVTGARRGELAALTWVDLDLDGGSVLIDKALQSRRVDREGRRVTGEVVAGPKTTSSVRRLGLDPITCELLVAHRAQVWAGRRSLGLAWADAAFVFASDPSGRQPVSKQAWSRRWARLQAANGVDGIRLHDLRHFVGVSLAQRRPLRVVMDQLGHSRMSTTAIYQVLEASPDVAELLAGTLDGFDQVVGSS